MLKKVFLLGVIALSVTTPTTAQAAPKQPKAKGCTLYGSKVPSGYQIDFQDRWGNTISSYVCWNGVWVRTMRA